MEIDETVMTAETEAPETESSEAAQAAAAEAPTAETIEAEAPTAEAIEAEASTAETIEAEAPTAEAADTDAPAAEQAEEQSGEQAEEPAAEPSPQELERQSRQREKFEKSKELKRSLIEEARALLTSTEWKKVAEEQKTLMERWKQAGYAAEENESLWKEFQSVRDTFYENRKKHYEELDGQRKEAAARKRELIEQVKAMTFSEESFDEDSRAMDEIFERWKKAGVAARELNDSLWEEFNKAREPFFAIRNERRKQQDAEYKEKRERKAQLIEETKRIIEEGNTGRDATDRIKELSAKWKEIGFSGRQGSEELWRDFKSAQDQFWAAKKEKMARRNEEYADVLRGAIASRQQRISKIRENIDNLTSRMMQPGGSNKAGQFLEYITQDQQQIEALKAEIDEINEKIATLEPAVEDGE